MFYQRLRCVLRIQELEQGGSLCQILSPFLWFKKSSYSAFFHGKYTLRKKGVAVPPLREEQRCPICWSIWGGNLLLQRREGICSLHGGAKPPLSRREFSPSNPTWRPTDRTRLRGRGVVSSTAFYRCKYAARLTLMSCFHIAFKTSIQLYRNRIPSVSSNGNVNGGAATVARGLRRAQPTSFACLWNSEAF